MSAENIINQIKKDSEKEIQKIQKETEKQTREILNQAKAQSEKEAEKILENGKTQSENIKKIMISKAQQEAKKEAMNTREKVIDECFTKAIHKLSTLKEQDYKRVLRHLIKNGKNKIPGKCQAIISRDIDKEVCKELNIPVVSSTESSGGVILKSDDGRVTLDITFKGILKRKKDKIRIKVGKLLFS